MCSDFNMIVEKNAMQICRSHLEIDVKTKLFPSDDMPGAAISSVQLPLEVVADGGVVPVELLHGCDQDVHHLNLQRQLVDELTIGLSPSSPGSCHS